MWFGSALLTKPENAKWRLPRKKKRLQQLAVSVSLYLKKAERKSVSRRLAPSHVLILVLPVRP